MNDRESIENEIVRIDVLLSSDNITDSQRETLEKIKADQEELIGIIDQVKVVERIIISLPEPITRDDTAAVNAAKDAYDKLTGKQMDMLDSKLFAKLEMAIAEISKPITPEIPPETNDRTPVNPFIIILLCGALIALEIISKKNKFAGK